jgi:membrane-bound lytic murein transglycosylase B
MGSYAFKRLTRADITGGFSDTSIELILLAMEHGGLGRMSSKGHCIIRNSAGQTTALSRNTGNGHKRTGNAAQDIKRLFPEIAEIPEPEVVEADDKMCAKCKHRKPKTEFGKNRSAKDGLQSYCAECMKIASKQSYERKKLRDAAETSESPSPEVVAPTPPPVPEEPLSAWEAVQRAVSAEMHEEIERLKAENARLLRALKKVAAVADNAIEEE